MRPDSHEIYGRRRSRNLGLGLVLAAFVLLIFAVTVVKLAEGAADARRSTTPTGRRCCRRRRTERWRRARANLRLALGLAAVVAAMVALSFAAVPFYDWFCRVTGYGGTTGGRRGAGGRRRSTAWSPSASTPTPRRACRGVPPGAAHHAGAARRDRPRLLRGATTRPTQPVAGQASYNVAPYRRRRLLRQDRLLLLRAAGARPRRAGRDAGELLRRPRDDRGCARRGGVTAITLSYTMHPADLPEEDARRPPPTVAARPPAAGRSNSRGTRAMAPATRTTTTTSCRRASGR